MGSTRKKATAQLKVISYSMFRSTCELRWWAIRHEKMKRSLAKCHHMDRDGFRLASSTTQENGKIRGSQIACAFGAILHVTLANYFFLYEFNITVRENFHTVKSSTCLFLLFSVLVTWLKETEMYKCTLK